MKYYGDNFWKVCYKFWDAEEMEYQYSSEEVDTYEQARDAFLSAVKHGQEIEGCVVISHINGYPPSVVLALSVDWNDNFEIPWWAD